MGNALRAGLAFVLLLGGCEGRRDDTEDVSSVRADLTVVSFVATKDTYVDSNAPTQNFGTATTLAVGRASGSLGDRQAYLYFDASNVTADVHSARLRLFVSDGTTAGPTLYGVGKGWNETTVTWNTKPTTDVTVRARTPCAGDRRPAMLGGCEGLESSSGGS